MVHLLLLQQPLILLPGRCGKPISQQVLRLCSLGSGIPHSSTSPTLHVPGPPPLRAALPHSKGNLGTTFFVPPHQSLDEVMHLVREVRGSAEAAD